MTHLLRPDHHLHCGGCVVVGLCMPLRIVQPHLHMDPDTPSLSPLSATSCRVVDPQLGFLKYIRVLWSVPVSREGAEDCDGAAFDVASHTGDIQGWSVCLQQEGT